MILLKALKQSKLEKIPTRKSELVELYQQWIECTPLSVSDVVVAATGWVVDDVMDDDDEVELYSLDGEQEDGCQVSFAV